MPIGVVAVEAGQVGLMNLSAITVFEQGGIHGGRVAIELHSQLQPILEHGRNQRPVGRYGRLLFDEGCQGDGLVNVGGGIEPRPFGAKALGENAAKLPCRGMASHAIRVGE